MLDTLHSSSLCFRLLENCIGFEPLRHSTEVKARVEILFRFKSLCEANLAELTALVVKEIACPCDYFECVMN